MRIYDYWEEYLGHSNGQTDDQLELLTEKEAFMAGAFSVVMMFSKMQQFGGEQIEAHYARMIDDLTEMFNDTETERNYMENN